ncbi:Crp/Fnr family transcriptional regulator [Rhodoferax sp.]|uniref:Crp/Fnr family transcriptional regulator n=1 Tax=Rhodoferax sp. TaxID=50421 RepID=UPI00260E9FC1|nr:Crp/Fnr family transcriptional regulator [Rhodoferax sp.]MDD2918043.1 Crp/Fnr family transcriptional regulator [Rhodoferax sp.]
MGAEIIDLQRFLAGSPLFSGLSPDELWRITQSSDLKNYTKGEMIFSVGEACEAFHIVVSGQVKLFVVSPAGYEKVIEIISPGQSFAEALVFLDKPYILSAQALADTVLVNVSKRGVVSEIEQDAHFALHMLAGVSRRLHGLIQDVEAYALRNGMQRLIGYLLRDVEMDPASGQNTVTVSLPASKATIASRLSLTPEYFSRVLHELEAQQLIAIDRRDIRIPDVQKLLGYGAQ